MYFEEIPNKFNKIYKPTLKYIVVLNVVLNIENNFTSDVQAICIIRECFVNTPTDITRIRTIHHTSMVPDNLTLLLGKLSIPLGTNKASSRTVTTRIASKNTVTKTVYNMVHQCNQMLVSEQKFIFMKILNVIINIILYKSHIILLPFEHSYILKRAIFKINLF